MTRTEAHICAEPSVAKEGIVGSVDPGGGQLESTLRTFRATPYPLGTWNVVNVPSGGLSESSGALLSLVMPPPSFATAVGPASPWAGAPGQGG